MKTPIQTAIDMINEKIRTVSSGGILNTPGSIAGLREADWLLRSLLDTEKQFAEACFEAGQNSIECYGGSITTDFSAFYKQYENE